MGIGSFPTVSLSDARLLRDEYKKLIKQGIHPRQALNAQKQEQEEKQRSLEVNTFGAVAVQYLDLKQTGFRNQKHIWQWRRSVIDRDGFCSSIIDKPIAEIDQDDVLSVFNPIWADRPETARRVLGRMASVLTYSIARKIRTDANPADWKVIQHVVKARPESERRKRHLPAMDYVQVPTFFERLQSWDAMAARALTLSLIHI